MICEIIANKTYLVKKLKRKMEEELCDTERLSTIAWYNHNRCG